MKYPLAKVVAVLGLWCLGPSLAAAQSWPQRPMKVTVPFAAGCGIDFIARVVGKHLSQRLGQQVVVENRAGAIALQALAKANPAGVTYASAGIGNFSRLAMELSALSTGVSAARCAGNT